MPSSRSLRRISLLIALACSHAAALESARPPGLGANDTDRFQPGPPEAAARYTRTDWVLVWHDEFAEGPAPSPTRWTYEHGIVRNHELQFYTTDRRENARIADGRLIITGRREPWEGAAYTSASLTTKGKFTLTYGKIEICAKIPTGRGTWPALWLLGDEEKTGWPLCVEIDLMENVGFDPERVHFTVHSGAFNHVQHTQRSRAIVVDQPWAEFHRYGLIWSPQRLEFFFDGEKVFEFVNDGQGVAHWPFDSPHYLILNLALGGAWGGQQGMDDRILPADFSIDYVRIWQQPSK